jgi:DNA-binding NarL/FixJ family response regulator
MSGCQRRVESKRLDESASSPESKILFVSQESSADVVREALGLGARGNVVKTNAGSELLEGVNALLQGDQFVSRRFSGHDFVGASDLHVPALSRTQVHPSAALTLPQIAEMLADVADQVLLMNRDLADLLRGLRP